ncbi:flagellar biosynthesis protein FlgA [Mycobacterium sp. 852013-51886_SCH5428379]|uniref:SAF domain-containing protein n=1 Tax=Mycobacterium sp. 852013-51886_SCH5428379 TaxID=1834111 RepID=UPI0007FD5191|nr:SAF domain-containing protein [Mycobacterium sp. 852013-51886_SCH5428379]OBB57748.1 flagellar biosynthesis protein FlgA [Mycobacterium sp. 852013-51886_SCH5428379]
MGESLAPSAAARLAELRPDWTRTVLARRIVAAALVALAAAAAVRSDPRGDRVEVVVAARDLSPGTALTADDVDTAQLPAELAPEGARVDTADVLGASLAGPARRGEVLTDVRLLGPRAAEATAGPDARLVPLHLSDTALLDLIRSGDVVDVLAGGAGDDGEAARPQVIATEAVVVLVSPEASGPAAAGDRVVLVALPARAANEVAGAALTRAVTLTFR